MRPFPGEDWSFLTYNNRNLDVSMILDSSLVAVSTGHEGYPAEPPYSPAVDHPEYPFDSRTLSTAPNPAYEGVRESLCLLDLDKNSFDTAQWNPLGEIIHPGDTVVLKPNFVRDFRETKPGHGNCLITHGSVIRAVLDYVYIAVGGKGRVIICDAPHSDADFEAICRIAGLDEIQGFYRRWADFNVEVLDLRPEQTKKINGVIVGHTSLPGDPAGYVKVNLGEHSMFTEINDVCHLLYGSEYNVDELHGHHHDNVHEYLISKTVLNADVVISLAKLKTHKKTGITVNMKNLVGINGNKNWLPHHREGTPSQGGDQFADDGRMHRIERAVMSCFRRLFPLLGPFRPLIALPIMQLGKWIFGDTNADAIRSGNWYGNDTTWRMVIDLNRILMYTDNNGKLHNTPVRRCFYVVDAIISGEGNGPLDPTPKHAGVVIAGFNPVAVDLVCARLMGFDYRKLPILSRTIGDLTRPLALFTSEDVIVVSNDPHFSSLTSGLKDPGLKFEPHFGWTGHIEIDPHRVCVNNNL